jgi:hypothetical protein
MSDPIDNYTRFEALVDGYEQIILEALSNREYTDWLRDPPPEFGERLTRDIGAALRTAHEERLRAARVALRNLVDLREEAAWLEVSDDNT